MDTTKQNPLGAAGELTPTRKPKSSYRKANRSSRFNQGQFNKALLPVPVAVLAERGGL